MSVHPNPREKQLQQRILLKLCRAHLGGKSGMGRRAVGSGRRLGEGTMAMAARDRRPKGVTSVSPVQGWPSHNS